MHQICSLINIHDPSEVKEDTSGMNKLVLSKDKQWLFVDHGLTGESYEGQLPDLNLFKIKETKELDKESTSEEFENGLHNYFDSFFFDNMKKQKKTNDGVDQIFSKFAFALLSSAELKNPTYGTWVIYSRSEYIVTDCDDLDNWDSELK